MKITPRKKHSSSLLKHFDSSEKKTIPKHFIYRVEHKMLSKNFLTPQCFKQKQNLQVFNTKDTRYLYKLNITPR